MVRQELSDDVKAQLIDIQSFNLKIAGSGWHVRERLLDSLNLSSINLHQSSFIECDLSDVKLNQSNVSETRFELISFAGVDFSHSKFNQVQFINCSFNFCIQVSTYFSHCSFINCQYADIKATSAIFENCEFETFDGQNSTFEGCKFIRTNFVTSQFEKISFYDVTIDRLTFSRCQANMLIFSNISGQQLKFEQGGCSHSGFSLSEFVGLGFFNCQIQGVTLDSFNITHLRLQDCPEISNFHVMESECNRPVLKNCGIVSELSFYHSKVSDLAFSDSTLAYFELVKSVLHGSSSISNSECNGISFADSKIDGLTVTECQFTDYLVLDRAHFKNLQLRQITYTGNLEVHAEDVVYENSNRFGRS